MNTQHTVKIHDAQIDSHIPVIALDSDNAIQIDYYGAFGTGPYIRCDELFAALKAHEPRTDADRVKFVESGRYDVMCTRGDWYIYDNVLKESVLGTNGDFDSWREAVDALMDLVERLNS